MLGLNTEYYTILLFYLHTDTYINIIIIQAKKEKKSKKSKDGSEKKKKKKEKK